MTPIHSYDIYQFQQQVNDCLDAIEKEPSEDRWENLRQLIASTPLAVSEPAKKRVFSLNSPVAAYSQTVELVEAQTEENRQTIFLAPVVKRLLCYLSVEDKAGLPTVSKHLLFHFDKEKVEVINRNYDPIQITFGIADATSLHFFLKRIGQELKRVNLTDVQITDQDLQLIAVACPQLTSLYIYNNHVITFEGFSEFAKMEQLKTFHLGCRSFNDRGVREIVKGMPQLQCLYFMGGHQMTSEGFDEIVNGLPNLQNLHWGSSCIKDAEVSDVNHERMEGLSFSGCVELSDAWLRKVIKRFPNLTSIELSHTQITKEGINDIVQSLSKLECLIINHSYRISYEGVDQLKREYPNIQILAHRW